ncbi:MAG: hypothetical protein CBB65_01540 [Hyphomonadaceae bacterium TMED5]|nr:GNAT family N-acetyltransferase [Ponticaulis sp.]OUY01315.1 MAG: hypothetical protein CBB65_01540 [Hyphomonadaceae bacterium TMED5]
MNSLPEELILRPARFEDVPAILDLIVKGAPGDEVRVENAPEAAYRAAFDAIEADNNQMLYVGEFPEKGVVCTMQLIFIPTLVKGGQWRMEMESVHVNPDYRGLGLGGQMLDKAVEIAKSRGCGLIQLTSNKLRLDAHRFYERYGFAKSHEGFKFQL